MCFSLNNSYSLFEELNQIVSSIDDSYSKQLFKARVEVDLYNSLEATCTLTGNNYEEHFYWVEDFKKTQKPIYIYGASHSGLYYKKLLEANGLNIVGFFDRNYQELSELYKKKYGFSVSEPPLNGINEYIYIYSV